MLKIKNFIKSSVILSALLLLFSPAKSYAWWGDHHYHSYRHYDHPHVGFEVSFLPHDCFSFYIGSSRYYYDDDVYYLRRGPEYVVVAPPVGAVVRTIPSYYELVMINGVPYYTNGGVYYVYTRRGYQIVPAPVTVVAAAPVTPTPTPPIIVTQPTSPPVGNVSSDDAFTINVPKSNGQGYTSVTIKRSGQGFVGPQGEFYSEFPKVEQLRVMYGK